METEIEHDHASEALARSRFRSVGAIHRRPQAAYPFLALPELSCMATVTDNDIGTVVQTPDGVTFGQIATVEGKTVYVDTDPGAFETVLAAIGWESNPEEAVPVDETNIERVTDEAVYIPADSLREGGNSHESVVERDEGTGERREATTETESESPSDQSGGSGDESDERHSEMDDAPPEGNRTVTKERGENESRRD